MRITFIGTAGWLPVPGSESACLLVDGVHLVDLGWNAALRMRELGLDPLAIESVTFTHMHQDHYLGLAPFLFLSGMKKGEAKRKGPLTIAGPAGRLEPVLAAAI